MKTRVAMPKQEKKKNKRNKEADDRLQPERVFDAATGFSAMAFSPANAILPASNAQVEKNYSGINTDVSISRKSEAADERHDEAVPKRKPDEKVSQPKNINGTSVCFYFQVHQPFRLRT